MAKDKGGVEESVTIQGYGVGKKAAVLLAILLLPIALPCLCLLSFFSLWLALPLVPLTLGFLLLKKAFVTNSHFSQLSHHGRVPSEIMMRAIGDGGGGGGGHSHSPSRGLRIEPPTERGGNATHMPAATVGKGKDKVDEISVASPSKPPLLIMLMPDEKPPSPIQPVEIDPKARPCTDQNEDGADTSVVAVSEAVKDDADGGGDGDGASATAIAAGARRSYPHELPPKLDQRSGMNHPDDGVGDSSSASTLTSPAPPAKTTPATHADQKKKPAKHHHHPHNHHHHHHKGRRHDHA